MTNPYGQQPYRPQPPNQLPQGWQQPPPPMWQPPAPKPPISSTANAALLIAVMTIPACIFALVWMPLVGALVGFWMIFVMIAAFILLPVILGAVTLREIKEGKAHPISRQRAVLAMGISGLWTLLALGVLIQWATGG